VLANARWGIWNSHLVPSSHDSPFAQRSYA
jgi:hypothetical protein